jgi:hypothetical protein
MARLQCDTHPLVQSKVDCGHCCAVVMEFLKTCSCEVQVNERVHSCCWWTRWRTTHGRTFGRTGTSPIHVTRAYHAHALLGPAGSPAAAILACNTTLHLLHHCSVYIACNRVISFSPWRIWITEALLTPTVPLCTESWIHRVKGKKKTLNKLPIALENFRHSLVLLLFL